MEKNETFGSFFLNLSKKYGKKYKIRVGKLTSSVSEIDGKSQGLEGRRLEPHFEQHRRIGFDRQR